jgi:hypothetical protein
VRIVHRTRYVWSVLVVAMVLAAAGCLPVERQAASTTTPEPALFPQTGGQTTVPSQGSEPAVSTPGPETAAVVPDNPFEAAAPGPRTPIAKMVPIEIALPDPAFRGTPVPPKEPNVEKPTEKPREPFYAPEGTVNLARGKPVAASDPVPPSGELDYVTDGDKEASDFGYLELRPGTEWVQVDLGQPATIYAVLVWHSHAEARVYRDVIVQVSDDPDFLFAQTIFNNDYDNSSGMGIGPDMGYVETSEGKLIDGRGVEGRYVRLYSKGNHIDEKNHYTEVEVYGRPLE